MTKAVLIHEGLGDVVEIDLDINPVKNEIFKTLQGPATFVGQWPELDVVIMKRASAEGEQNNNTLPSPFSGECILGKILLVRMDVDSEPQDFTLDEYNRFILQRTQE
jgi:hypothetical protein